MVHQLALSPNERDKLEEICSFALYKLNSCDYYHSRFTASQLIEKLYADDFEDVCVFTIPEGMVSRFLKMIKDVSDHTGAPKFAKSFENEVLGVLQ